ncbi:MAG: zf-HC2 domain-containing protein [Eubacteriales bacterium]|nr:zf-HC2 domain-containing protein [Lachnospiraceae bacterium]MDO5127971.1 zf-HC2 domain-containing protein [Eubacteriales bacterium]
MTCLEAQSNIMAFIEKKLPDDKVTDFVRHMHYCKNCSEELEIYYTLIVGMRQLDNNEELSKDFTEELNRELNRVDHKVKNVKRFKISTFSMVFAAIVVLMFFFYNRILNKVYNIEQFMIKEQQGDSYFYDFFGEEISLCKEDIVVKYSTTKPQSESTFYEKIHAYNLSHQEAEDVEDDK